MKRILFAALALFFSILPLSASAQTNQVTLTTYYPSPFGVYDRLRLFPRADLNNPPACDSGTIYYKNSDNTVQLCTAGVWGPLTGGVFKMVVPGRAPGFDPENPLATIDQYIPAKLYPDITTTAPYLGIGTNNPQRPLHVAVASPNVVTGIALENFNPTDNNGVSISFRGDASNSGGYGGGFTTFNEFAAIKAIKIFATQDSYTTQLSFVLSDGLAYQNILNLHSDSGGVVGIGKTTPDARLDILASPIAKPYLTLDTDNVPANAGNVLIVNSAGNVGINQKNPGTNLEVNGNIKATTLTLTSDATLKKDIAPLTNALDKVSRLNGISFEWKDNPKDSRKHLGVLAQDVEKIFPELVYGQEGAKSVDYPSLIAPLIEAVKELKKQNEDLSQKLQEQSAQIREQQNKIDALQNSRSAQQPSLTTP